MKRIIYTLFCLLCFTLQLSAQNGEIDLKDKRLKGLDKQLNKIVDQLHLPGLAVAVISNDQILFSKGYGYRDVDKELPVDANTLFMIGSCSKAFTASLIGQLAHENLLTLNDSPRKHLKNLDFYNTDLNEKIQLRDMMCHQTGLPRHDFSWYLFPPKSAEEVIARMKYQEPTEEFRKKFQYNNFMYALQGFIIENIKEKPYKEVIEEQIFTPLQMNRSCYLLSDLQQDSNHALPYLVDSSNQIIFTDYHPINIMGPAGSIGSSANDMAKWIQLWLNDGKIKEEEIIPVAFLKEAISAQSIMKSSLPSSSSPDRFFGTYGYGWMQENYRGHYLVHHGGSIDGFSTQIGFFPSDNLGIVVLCNQNKSAAPALINQIIADKLLNLTQKPYIKDYLKQQKDFQALKKEVLTENVEMLNTSASHPIEDYTGSFNHPGYGTFKIKHQHDSLMAIFDQEHAYLKRKHYDIYIPHFYDKNTGEYTDNNALTLNFRGNTYGKLDIIEIPLEMDLDPIQFKRTYVDEDIPQELVQSYCGEYHLGPQTSIVSLKAGKDLVLNISGQPEYKLEAIGKHTYKIEGIDQIEISFMPNEEGVFTKLKFKQPQGTFVAIKVEKPLVAQEIITVSPKKLQTYTGKYKLNDMVIKVYKKGKTTLCMLVPNQPEYTLESTDKHHFKIKGLTGYSVSFDMEKEKPSALNLHQPQGTFKAIAL